ncbi:MAG: phosphonate ABC transporter, permease protein PhnE [Candidatus Sericytochromatia bacterium]|nr:phosphonate ABC transporter, permease protein PhnE [Candidatus Tanganyikabacteria bacterium]
MRGATDQYLDLPRPPRSTGKRLVVTLSVLAVLAWAFLGTQFNPAELVAGLPKMADMAKQSWPPDWGRLFDPADYHLPEELTWQQTLLPGPLTQDQQDIRDAWWSNTWPQTILGGTIQTIQMAIAGTALAALFSFPLGFLAARNTSPHPSVYFGVKVVVNVLRSIPDFAVGLVLISAIGLGPFTGVSALAFATTTVLVKLFSEAIENIDQGVVEAIQATGANRFQVYSFAVVPQVMADFISFVIYRFEANIRAATVLGLIGAGGIGLLMNADFRTFQYQQAAVSVLVLIVLVLIVDFASARLRRMVQ